MVGHMLCRCSLLLGCWTAVQVGRPGATLHRADCLHCSTTSMRGMWRCILSKTLTSGSGHALLLMGSRYRDIVQLPQDFAVDACPERLQARPCSRPIPLPCSTGQAVGSPTASCGGGATNGERDGDETDVDCGGGQQGALGCTACSMGSNCDHATDCEAGLACGQRGTCIGEPAVLPSALSHTLSQNFFSHAVLHAQLTRTCSSFQRFGIVLSEAHLRCLWDIANHPRFVPGSVFARVCPQSR